MHMNLGTGDAASMFEFTYEKDWSLDSNISAEKKGRLRHFCTEAMQALQGAARASQKSVNDASLKQTCRFVPETRKAFRRSYRLLQQNRAVNT